MEPMEEDGDLRRLSKQLETVIRRLDLIEAVLTEQRSYPELAALMGDLKMSANLYNEPLKLIQRLITAKRIVQRSEEPRDEVSRLILNSLAIRGPMNVSGLAREITSVRGSASRVTVRKRLKALLEEGVVVKDEDGSYRLRE
jgi:DNA-binding transcriptional ArsR family regulator